MFKYLIAVLLFFSTSAIAESNSQAIVLTTTNTVNFRGVVTEPMVIDAQLKLVSLVLKRAGASYPIYLVIDSPGGYIDAGLSFIAFAKTIKNLHTIVIDAASMAAFTTEALPGKRYMTEDASLMFHRATGGFEGQFEVGEVESRLEQAKRMILRMETKVAARLGISLEAYKAKAINEWWLDADEALKNKAIDAKADIVCTPTLIKSREFSLFQTLFGVAKLSYSGCPLFRYPLPSAAGAEEE